MSQIKIDPQDRALIEAIAHTLTIQLVSNGVALVDAAKLRARDPDPLITVEQHMLVANAVARNVAQLLYGYGEPVDTERDEQEAIKALAEADRRVAAWKGGQTS